MMDISHLSEREQQERRNIQARVTRNRRRYERLNQQLQALQRKTDKSYSMWARADEDLYLWEKERGLS
jgi:hypothetical protein